MIKDRTTQLIFQTAFCTLGIVAVAASLGLFNASFANNFYVYFTNLSNYFGIIIVFFELVQTIRKKDDTFTTVLPLLKFMGALMLLLTFVVYNFILAKSRPLEMSFTVSSILLHIVLPLMYIADWFMFYERRSIKWYYPLFSMIPPLIYVGFIFIRAWILNGEGDIIYPYFFLDLDTLGWGGVLQWVAILLSAFVAVGYIFFTIDNLLKSKIKSHT